MNWSKLCTSAVFCTTLVLAAQAETIMLDEFSAGTLIEIANNSSPDVGGQESPVAGVLGGTREHGLFLTSGQGNASAALNTTLQEITVAGTHLGGPARFSLSYTDLDGADLSGVSDIAISLKDFAGISGVDIYVSIDNGESDPSTIVSASSEGVLLIPTSSLPLDDPGYASVDQINFSFTPRGTLDGNTYQFVLGPIGLVPEPGTLLALLLGGMLLKRQR